MSEFALVIGDKFGTTYRFAATPVEMMQSNERTRVLQQKKHPETTQSDAYL